MGLHGWQKGRIKDGTFEPLTKASSLSLAAHLVANLTSPSGAAVREESMQELRRALDSMDAMDREVLALRHFEELGNNEVAQILGIQVTAASMRYVRALKRLREILSAFGTEPAASPKKKTRPGPAPPPPIAEPLDQANLSDSSASGC